jgi:hypothetical protein
MNNKKQFDLLSDIAKLIKKYGPETFEALGDEISSPEFTERLVEVLITTATVYRKLPQVKRNSRRHSPKLDFRSTLARSEAEKFRLLLELHDALKNKSVLPTLREMKDFATDNGLPPVKSTSREKALIPFIRTFLRMPAENIREYLRRIQPRPTSDDRTLEGWSKIIFGNEHRASKN